MQENRPIVRIICGPTGVGKTEVALQCAERLGAHIVSFDAMKVYRGMDIGTAKPTPEELARVPHHMLSWLDIDESNSLGKFLKRAEAVIRDLHAREIPIVVDGGSIMYVKGLVEGVFEGPGRDAEIRNRLRNEADEYGVPFLHERLQRVDPEAAKKIGPNDYKRIERALEVFEMTGKPISSFQTQWGKQRSDLDIRLVGIRRDRAVLYERINQRALVMLENGWIEECRELLERPMSREALTAHGYRAVFAFLRGEIDREEMIDRIQKDTRHYAKRQLSWFSKFPGIRWVEADGKSAEDIARETLAIWERQGENEH